MAQKARHTFVASFQNVVHIYVAHFDAFHFTCVLGVLLSFNTSHLNAQAWTLPGWMLGCSIAAWCNLVPIILNVIPTHLPSALDL